MIILLNGVSSAGKTSIAKEIQKQAPIPFLHIGVDWFCSLLPDDYLWYGPQAQKGIWFEQYEKNGEQRVAVKSGPAGATLFKSVPHVLAAFAAAGNHLIIDEVSLNKKYFEKLVTTLRPYKLTVVKVEIPLTAVQQREQDRGDRSIGLAADQFDVVHAHSITYDITVHTDKDSAAKCAQEVLKYSLATSAQE